MDPDSEPNHDLLRRASANLARIAEQTAKGSGKPWERWDDMVAIDLGLATPAPPNSAVLLGPLDGDHAVSAVMDRVSAFFEGHTGGGWQIWTAWPIGDLQAWGYEPFEVPCMVRDAGPAPPSRPAPSGLSVRAVTDAEALRDTEALLIDAFDVPDTEPGSMFGVGVLDDPSYRSWVGYVDGRAVSTSTAYLSDGFVGVYNVATASDARGRGYGEALTWYATLADPSLPAVLGSSPMGRPIYERMGYRPIGTFSVWERKVPARTPIAEAGYL